MYEFIPLVPGVVILCLFLYLLRAGWRYLLVAIAFLGLIILSLIRK